MPKTPKRYTGFKARNLTEEISAGRVRLNPRGKNVLLGKRIREIGRILSSPNPVLTSNPHLEKARDAVNDILQGKRPAVEIYEAMHDLILQQLKRKRDYHRNLVNLIRFSKNVYDHYSIHFKNADQLRLAKDMLSIYERHKGVEPKSEEGLRMLELSVRQFAQYQKQMESGQTGVSEAQKMVALVKTMPPEPMGLKDPKPWNPQPS